LRLFVDPCPHSLCLRIDYGSGLLQQTRLSRYAVGGHGGAAVGLLGNDTSVIGGDIVGVGIVIRRGRARARCSAAFCTERLTLELASKALVAPYLADCLCRAPNVAVLAMHGFRW
jgi:hypothetical protein